MGLTPVQLNEYARDGFILLKGLISEDDVALWSRRFEDLVLGKVERPEKLVIMKDVLVAKGEVVPASPLHAITKILSFEEDPVLWQYTLDKALLDVVKSIAGPSLFTISSNVFNKPPGLSSRHPLHQDLRYFAYRPADKIVASWTAIDATTRENGCLAVIPGSHKTELRRHGNPDWEHVNFGFFAAEDVDLQARVHVEMDPGDTLIFHPLLIHGSGRNRSDGFRRAISTHYASQECERPDRARKRQPVTKEVPKG